MTRYTSNRATPWGKANTSNSYERGIAFVSTPRHGGWLVGKGYAKKHLSTQAQEAGVDFGSYLAYEEDCLAAVIDYELLLRDGDKFLDWSYDGYAPESKPSRDEHLAALRDCISRWVPTYTRHIPW